MDFMSRRTKLRICLLIAIACNVRVGVSKPTLFRQVSELMETDDEVKCSIDYLMRSDKLIEAIDLLYSCGLLSYRDAERKADRVAERLRRRIYTESTR